MDNSAALPFVLSSTGSGPIPIPPTPPALPYKSKLRMHKKGSSSVGSVNFLGETYWKSRAPQLVSLEVANQTPSIIKRGFEYMYHKSHGYRLTGGSLYFGPNLVRKSQRDALPRGALPTCLDSDALPTTSVSSDQREKHDSAIAVDTCNDSAKKVLKAALLISLEEAQRREASRRNRAANHATKKEARVEREVSRLKREVAEIAWKKVQAKREEEGSITRQEKESQEKKGLQVPGTRKQEGQMLTAAVAAREDGLVVAPTNWIVPLISLDEARHTEKAKRGAADTKLPIPLPSSPPPAVTSVNSLTVNAGNGNTTTLRLVSLESARRRDRARRLEEEATLITLTEARKQDALRRNASSQRVIETGSADQLASRKDASTPQEKARWLALMSNAENH